MRGQEKSTISYAPHQGVSPKSEAEALAAAYEFVLRCAEERKKGSAAHTANDGKEIKNAPANGSIPR